jgi:hypothetical protein
MLHVSHFACFVNFNGIVYCAGPGSDAFHLTAEKHTTNNALSFFRDPAKKYALPEKWTLISVANDGYQIQNQRTGFCLISGGYVVVHLLLIYEIDL